MRMIVFIRQVTDPENTIITGADRKCINDDHTNWIINPFDEYALEEAFCIREAYGGKITVVGAGPPRISSVLRTALAMGADEGILVLDDTLAPWDSVSRAQALAACIQPADFDLVFIGQRSIDGEIESVGQRLAHYLKVPCLSHAVAAEIVPDRRTVRIHRRIDGQEMVVESVWPAVVSVEKGLKEVRSFSISGLNKARQKRIEEKMRGDLDAESAAVAKRNQHIRLRELSRIFDQRKLRKIAGDTPEEQAAELFRVLRDQEKIL